MIPLPRATAWERSSARESLNCSCTWNTRPTCRARTILNLIDRESRDELPVIPLWQTEEYYTWSDRLNGPAPTADHLYQGIEKWEIAPWYAEEPLVILTLSSFAVLGLAALGSTLPLQPKTPAETKPADEKKITSKAKVDPAKPKDAAADSKDKTKTDPKAKADADKAKTAAARKLEPPSTPIEDKPYKIKMYVAVDPKARLDVRGRQNLIDSWLTFTRRFVGPPWEIQIAPDAGPLGGLNILAIDRVAVLKAGENFDKVWLILVQAARNGYELIGREYDMRTARLGQPFVQPCPWPADAPRILFQLTLDMFSPSADVGDSVADAIKLRVQASGLPVADPIGAVVKPGTYFRPIRAFLKPDGKTVIRMQEVQYTFLEVSSVNGNNVICSLVTTIRSPFIRRARGGRITYLVLGVKPANFPSRFKFTEGPQKNPAAGYVLTAQTYPKGSPRELGTTDRQGRIVLPPDFAKGLVMMYLLGGKVEPLARFPWMPGESAEEMTIQIIPHPDAVALETTVNAMRDQIYDLVGQRSRLLKKMKNRIQSDNWDEAKKYVAQFKKLDTAKIFEERIKALKDDATRRQTESKKPILTPQAQKLIASVDDLIARYLDDKDIETYEDTIAAHDASPGRKSLLDEPEKKKAGAPGGFKLPDAGKMTLPNTDVKPPEAAPAEKAEAAPAEKKE